MWETITATMQGTQNTPQPTPTVETGWQDGGILRDYLVASHDFQAEQEDGIRQILSALEGNNIVQSITIRDGELLFNGIVSNLDDALAGCWERIKGIFGEQIADAGDVAFSLSNQEPNDVLTFCL